LSKIKPVYGKSKGGEFHDLGDRFAVSSVIDSLYFYKNATINIMSSRIIV